MIGEIKRQIGRRWRKLRYAGRKYHCPICDSRLKTFLPFIGIYNLYGKPVDHYTRYAVCPVCLSQIRHRFLVAYLKSHPQLLRGRKRKLLHLAPEDFLRRFLLRIPDLEITFGDLQPRRYGFKVVQVNLLQINFPDESFDAIICNHVLEHIVDDQKAMAEMWRILKPGGWALITLPIYGETTYEKPGLDANGRIFEYGIHDHMRLNGLDVTQKFEKAGFRVRVETLDSVPGNYFERSENTPHIQSDRYLFLLEK
ncbi:MAG: class I SAM-dependent methyltransferase [Bacteroidia bacterium]|nr:methyltransferase domain-containing protein [Bacteroidia bacterium]MDW8334183.1 class I SAM-dependent methyltransferase [Bacteroidia bacterium]